MTESFAKMWCVIPVALTTKGQAKNKWQNVIVRLDYWYLWHFGTAVMNRERGHQDEYRYEATGSRNSI